MYLVRPLCLTLALIHGSETFAQTANGPFAIRCVGTVTQLPANSEHTETRTFIVDERAKAIFIWIPAAGGKTNLCKTNCQFVFGEKLVKIVEAFDYGGESLVQIDREKGSVLTLVRTIHPPTGEVFAAAFTKTAMPMNKGKRKL